MNEKEKFLNVWHEESATTKRTFEAYPDNQLDWRPHEKSKNAREQMWLFISENKFLVSDILRGSIDWSHMIEMPAGISKSELVKKYEESVNEVKAALMTADESDLNKTMKFPSGPKALADIRIFDVIWSFLMDQIHHRGQFSVYIRMAGGKVPSIYGPSADEPWE